MNFNIALICVKKITLLDSNDPIKLAWNDFHPSFYYNNKFLGIHKTSPICNLIFNLIPYEARKGSKLSNQCRNKSLIHTETPRLFNIKKIQKRICQQRQNQRPSPAKETLCFSAPVNLTPRLMNEPRVNRTNLLFAFAHNNGTFREIPIPRRI